MGTKEEEDLSKAFFEPNRDGDLAKASTLGEEVARLEGDEPDGVDLTEVANIAREYKRLRRP